MKNNTSYGTGALENNLGANNTAIGSYSAYNILDASNNPNRRFNPAVNGRLFT